MRGMKGRIRGMRHMRVGIMGMMQYKWHNRWYYDYERWHKRYEGMGDVQEG